MEVSKEILEVELEYCNLVMGELQTRYKLINEIYKTDHRKRILEYLSLNECKTLVIYGAGTIGKAFFDLVKDAVDTVYICDKSKSTIFDYDGKNIYDIGDLIDKTIDLIIVTPMEAYAAIEKDLNNQSFCCVKSIASLIRMPELGKAGLK